MSLRHFVRTVELCDKKYNILSSGVVDSLLFVKTVVSLWSWNISLNGSKFIDFIELNEKIVKIENWRNEILSGKEEIVS